MSTSDASDSINGSSSKDIIYGTGYGLGIVESLIFVPKDFAEHQATLIDGLASSRTWGEVKANLPRDIYKEVLAHHGYGTEDGGEPEPQAEKPFNIRHVPGVGDGDWPTWLLAYQLEWVPPYILSEFSKWGTSILNGDAVDFDPADERKIVRAFRKLGYTCVRDDNLLGSATYG